MAAEGREDKVIETVRKLHPLILSESGGLVEKSNLGRSSDTGDAIAILRSGLVAHEHEVEIVWEMPGNGPENFKITSVSWDS
jgi:hypothetical protein